MIALNLADLAFLRDRLTALSTEELTCICPACKDLCDDGGCGCDQNPSPGRDVWGD